MYTCVSILFNKFNRKVLIFVNSYAFIRFLEFLCEVIIEILGFI